MSEHLASSLKRLYDECDEVLEREEARKRGGAIIDRFNELLWKAEDEYPDNSTIEDVDPVQRSGAGVTPGSDAKPHSNDLQQVKFRVTSIADAIGLDMDDFKNTSESDTMPLIELNQAQEQTQQQSATQSVTVEQLRKDVDGMMATDEEKSELRDLINQLESELNSDNPEPGQLREIVNSARDFSSQVAMKIAMSALERGIDILAN
jgi:hypothetical protein